MAVGSVNYSSPVTVNGFLCRNCTDVDYAAKHIDPSHPRSGPNDVDAANDPTRPVATKLKLADAKQASDRRKAEQTHYSVAGAVAGQALAAGSVIDLRA